ALGEYAASLGLQIALELEPFQLSLLNTVPAMAQFLDDVHHPAVAANIDISHLALAHSAPEELRSLKGRAIHVHISDCDGKVHGDLPPGRGVVDFLPYLREIADLGIEAMSIELEYSPEPEKIREWVAEAYTATDRLMQAAGIPRGSV
ncbi:MAG: sugar phosphate isomerase/epimerase family protein, partial [Gemmataceae bacterium]